MLIAIYRILIKMRIDVKLYMIIWSLIFDYNINLIIFDLVNEKLSYEKFPFDHKKEW